MPKQTFFNLPEEKRQRIIEAAIDEFAAHPFREASVAGLISRAGIPRGSFYQYFKDMKDVYLYLMQIIADHKIRYISEGVTREQDSDFFSRMKSLYVISMKYAADNPRLTAIGMHLFKDDIHFRQEIMGSMAGKSNDFFIEFFEQAQARGEIRPGVDIVMVSFILSAINSALIDYLKVQGQLGDIFTNPEGYLQVIDKMLDILEHGIGA